jgi:hypothetical protein
MRGRMRIKRSWIAGLAIAGLFVTAAVPGSAKGYRSRTERIAPGVTYTVIRDPKGPFRIRVVRVDLDRRSTFDVELAHDKLPGWERTSSMARRRGAIAAINGDYGRPSGRPVMAFAEDGRLLQTPLAWGRNFSVNRTETATFIGHPRVSVWAHESDTSLTHVIDRVNEGLPEWDEVAQFTSEGGTDERPPEYACAARVYPQDSPHLNFDGTGVETTHSVEEARCKSRRMFPKGGSVLAAPIGGSRELEVSSLVPGEQVILGWSLGWPNVFDTVGGNPTLVENGAISVQQQNDPFFKRHPRTGVGSTSDGRVLMVTVDGRQPGYSVGMTPRQFARLFISLGAEWALNLDGGGSTTTVIRGKVTNRPSDGKERPVSSALLLLPRGDSGEIVGPQAAPSPSPSPTTTITGMPPSEVWNTVVHDPASTGGLASTLYKGGAVLPPSLQRAAKKFLQR